MDARPPPAAPEEPLPEGRESPPPGVRAMGAVRWGLVVLMAAAAAGAWMQTVARAPQASARPVTRYQCPMHPAVLTDHPSDCPICGMDLVLVNPAAAQSGPALGELAPVELTPERVQLAGLRSAPVRRERLVSELRVSGTVAAPETGLATVTTRFGGYVEELKVRETGQRVARGEVLATIASPEMLSAQQSFLNALRWAQSRGSGQSESSSQVESAGAATILEKEARRKLEAAGVWPQDIAALLKAGAPLPTIPIRAPIGGLVGRRSVFQGALVQAGSELFQLADLSRAWVLASLPEQDAGRVRVGQRARLEFRSWPGRRFEGRVGLVYPGLSPDTRALLVRIELPNPGLELKPGMSGAVVLEAAVEGLSAPAEAVVDTGDRQYVFVALGEGRFEPRPVRVGARAGDRVQILEGLAEGEAVVTSGGFLLDSESRLRAAVGGGASPRPEHDERAETAGR